MYIRVWSSQTKIKWKEHFYFSAVNVFAENNESQLHCRAEPLVKRVRAGGETKHYERYGTVKV